MEEAAILEVNHMEEEIGAVKVVLGEDNKVQVDKVDQGIKTLLCLLVI